MILEVGQFVFGTVWEVREYGLMINTPDAWGLLHKSNIPCSIYSQDSFKKFASVNDVLILKITESNKNNVSLAFSAKYSKKPKATDVFKKQFGSLDVNASIKKINTSDNIADVDIKFNGCQNYLYGYFDLNDVDDFEISKLSKLKESDNINVQIIGYDYEKKKLICHPGKSWAQILNSEIETNLKGNVTNIHLNAIEISLKNYGKLMIPFEELPGYCRGYENLLELSLQQVDIILDFRRQKNPIRVITDLFVQDAAIKNNANNHTNNQKTVIFLGATGSGKSSLINSIIKYTETDIPFAKTGLIDPTTKALDLYKCRNLKIFDSPGVGESTEEDKKTLEIVKGWFKENQKCLPITVLVFDANSRDYGSTFRLVREIREYCSDRLICCINKVDTLFPFGIFSRDLTIPGNCSDRILQKIEEKIDSVIARLSDAAGVQGHGISTASQVATDKGKKVAFHIKQLIDQIDSIRN